MIASYKPETTDYAIASLAESVGREVEGVFSGKPEADHGRRTLAFALCDDATGEAVSALTERLTASGLIASIRVETASG
jgi:hypothetical protein